jgi:hypothetical protein
MVGHLFEGHRPEDITAFLLVLGDQPRQKPTHQIGHGAEHLVIPVITWQGSGCIGLVR